ncbi:YkgJ family cysteine cluster protein [Inquilinus limosus]|uniref:YkgJ family cysteine cluster protein n=1 Tax=Inquilinus limosus TaxID=171674 RepID=UPI0004294F45|nr:YkgJ family cysteine cluster protein [Inquilinus limosus]
MGETSRAGAAAFDCRACGACCAFSRDWPRFWTESAAEIERVPRRYRDDARMRCDGDRCTALEGEIGRSTRCAVYADRPVVCRDCAPGDDACRIARAGLGLAV